MVSLGRLLIDSIPGDAITIVHGDREAIAADDRGSVRQRASHHLLRRLLRYKIASRYGNLTTEGSQGPPETIYGLGFNDE